MEAMRVLLVDDHILFRKGLAALISSHQNLVVVGEASDGWEGVKLAREIKPDVILMDVHMPNLDGLEAVKIITEEMPNIIVVMLSIDDDDDTLFQAIKSGAKGYLLKNLEPQELYKMLDKLQGGEAAISGAMATKILREFMPPFLEETKQESSVEELTSQEIKILEAIVKGANNKEIANTLGITDSLFRAYLRSILRKLRLQNRVQIAVHAVREGLVNDTPELYR